MSLSLTMHACSSDSQKAFIESVYRSTGKKKENYESLSQRSQFFIIRGYKNDVTGGIRMMYEASASAPTSLPSSCNWGYL